ncbi:MAG: DUF7096 domain-containing protein [Halobacteriota archaeon]
MDGTRILLFALLLCVAPIGGVVTGSDAPSGLLQVDGDSDGSMSVVSADNTSEYLAPPSGSIDRTEQQTTGLDVAGAIEGDTGRLRSAYLHDSLRRQYENADTDTDRRAVVESGVERFSQRAEALDATQTSAIRRFNNGTVSERELLRTLATVHREAEATNEALEWLDDTAEDHAMDAAADQAVTAQVRLVPMGGPVRAQLSRSFESGSSSRVYVETAADGIVLATVSPTEDTYLREAYDPTAKRADVSDQYDGNPSPALDRFTELYPWATNRFEAIDAMGPAQVRLYRFRASHSHGSIETYLDSGSTEILYETQRIDVESMPTTTFEQTNGDLQLVLNATRSGGPLGIAVVDTSTGQFVDASIELNDEPIGSTDGDRLWVVAPRGAATVNATHEGESVALNTHLG